MWSEVGRGVPLGVPGSSQGGRPNSGWMQVRPGLCEPFPVGTTLLGQPGTDGIDEEATGGEAVRGGLEQAALEADQ